MKYFAYGSNMAERRMIDRGVKINHKVKAVLNGYRFTINKRSFKIPEIGFANIIQDENSFVEGILYDIDDKYIEILDKFEGFPKHYYRIALQLKIDDKIDTGVVYIAQPEWTVKGELRTTQEYKNFILEGKEFLSENYYEKLNENIKV